MGVKETLILIYRLVSKPADTWDRIAGWNESKEEFQHKLFYPLLGVVALSAFVGVFINLPDFSFQIALKKALVLCVSFLGGIYGTMYGMEYVYRRYFDGEIQPGRFFVFSGYCYAPVMLLVCLLQLFPDFIFLNFLYLIIPYLAWEGVVGYFVIEQPLQLRFTAFVSVFLMAIPWLLKTFMFLFMPGLRV